MGQWIEFVQRLYSRIVTQLQEKVGPDYQRHTGSEASVPPMPENMEDPPRRPHRSWWRRAPFPPGYVHRYWEQVGKDLQENLALSKRILVALLAYVIASTAALYIAEHALPTTKVSSLGSALYYTWVTMATVANADPADPWGRLITATDVAVGLLTFGFIVWLITKSLTQTSLNLTAIEQRLDRIEALLNRPTIDERLIALLPPNLQPKVKQALQANLNEVPTNITRDPAPAQLTRAVTTTTSPGPPPPRSGTGPGPAPKKPDRGHPAAHG